MTITFAGFVYFKFYSKESATFAVEDGVGFVIVILYAVASFKSTVTVIAIGVIVTAITIIGVICVDYSSTVYTGVVVVVIAVLT